MCFMNIKKLIKDVLPIITIKKKWSDKSCKIVSHKMIWKVRIDCVLTNKTNNDGSKSEIISYSKTI